MWFITPLVRCESFCCRIISRHVLHETSKSRCAGFKIWYGVFMFAVLGEVLHTFWFITSPSLPSPFLYPFRFHPTDYTRSVSASFDSALILLFCIPLSLHCQCLSLSLSSYLYSHSLHGALVVSHHKGRAVYRLLVTGWKRGRGGVRVVAAWTVNIQWCCWGCPLTDTVSCCITDPKWHAIKFKWHPPQRDHSNYDGSWRGGMAPRIFRKIILKVAIFRGAQRWKFWQMQIQYDIEMLSWPIADIYRRQYPVPVFIDEWKTRNHRFHQT